ncbi:unnamed protein product [[Candida] boidinii]|uniref:Unnamed protein product n=1 Tax=Candida boidinii TaxID=5477 RepID=A0A9W6T327_CANBO|nr:unnamed protein product [[Candida] boidinii]
MVVRLNSLPPPPEKSILKKSRVNNNTLHSNSNNNKFRKNSATSSSSVLFSDSENEDDETKQSELEAYDAYDDDDTALENNRFLSKLAPRRKSLVEMTDEEILALDEQFSKKAINIDKFSFNSTPSVYTDNTVTKKNERSGSNGSNNNYTKAKLDNFSKNGKYPTNRTISHGSCCLTVKHSDFPNILLKENTSDSSNDDTDDNDSEELMKANNLSSNSAITKKKKKRNYKTYLKNINTKENLLAKRLNENTRVIMTVISGKNSTWSTIDYFLKDIARDGDIFIITCSLPIAELMTHKLRKKKSNTNGCSNTNGHDDSFVNTNEEGLYHNDTTYTISLQEAQKISEVIVNYTLAKLEKLNPTAKLQITVELMNTKDSSENYKEAIKIYSPKLVLMGTTLKNSILQNAQNSSPGPSSIHGGAVAANISASDSDDDVKKIMKFTPAIIQSYPVPVILVQTSTLNCPLAKAKDHGNDDAPPMTPGSTNNNIDNMSPGIDTTATPNLTNESVQSSSTNQTSNTIKAGSVIFKQPFVPKIEISQHRDNDDISINSSSSEDEDLFKNDDLSRRKSRAMTNATNPNEFEYDEEDEILTETLLSNTSNLNDTSSIFTRRLIILSTKLATDLSVDEFLNSGLSDDFSKLSFSNYDLKKTKSLFPTSDSTNSNSNNKDSTVLSTGRHSDPEVQSFGANLYKPITITSSNGAMVIDKASRAKFNEMAASVGLSPNLTSIPNSNAKSGSSIIDQYNRRMSVQTPPTGSTSGPSSSSRKKSSLDPIIPASPSATNPQMSADSSSSSSNHLKVPSTYTSKSASNSTSSLTYEIPSPLMKLKTAGSSNSSLVKTKSRSKSSGSSGTSPSKSGFFGKLFKK